jgi:hypothetical protein
LKCDIFFFEQQKEDIVLDVKTALFCKYIALGIHKLLYAMHSGKTKRRNYDPLCRIVVELEKINPKFVFNKITIGGFFLAILMTPKSVCVVYVYS